MKLTGLCVSKGTVKGNVKILHDKKENSNEYDLKFGSPTIIVMKKLDRDYLVEMDKSIVGVIAEEGNIGSHGAGILRQLKIPCILRIKNATKIMVDDTPAEIIGHESCVLCSTLSNCHSTDSPNSTTFSNLYYKNITKESFYINEIKPIKSWICPRPDRIYQELRYGIICDVFSSSGNFLFGLPIAKVDRNSAGAIISYGSPSISDVCSFILCNPSWLIDKSKERTLEFDKIKEELNLMKKHLNEKDLNDIYHVFKTGIKLYRSLFKYAYISQAISDEFLDIYLDFIYQVTGQIVTKDVLNLKSEYVESCLSSGIDPGVSQKWNSQKNTPHIWEGKINYTLLERDNNIIEAIQKDSCYNRLMRDYNAFRLIIPLVYQLSEEFFYLSSSINSFINWSIINICHIENALNRTQYHVDKYYNMTLEDFCKQVESSINKEDLYV